MRSRTRKDKRSTEHHDTKSLLVVGFWIDSTSPRWTNGCPLEQRVGGAALRVHWPLAQAQPIRGAGRCCGCSCSAAATNGQSRTLGVSACLAGLGRHIFRPGLEGQRMTLQCEPQPRSPCPMVVGSRPDGGHSDGLFVCMIWAVAQASRMSGVRVGNRYPAGLGILGLSWWLAAHTSILWRWRPLGCQHLV